MNVKTKIIISVLLVIFGVAMRVLPHAWNFTPIVAIVLFAGVYFGRNYVAPILIVMMLLSDFIIGFYSTPVMLSVYGSFLLIGGISLVLNKYKSITTVVAGSIVSSTLFYLITNFAVWKFSTMYVQTINGLVLSYEMALPFFRNMLVGDLVFVGILFGSYEVSMLIVRHYAQRKVKA